MFYCCLDSALAVQGVVGVSVGSVLGVAEVADFELVVHSVVREALETT